MSRPPMHAPTHTATWWQMNGHNCRGPIANMPGMPRGLWRRSPNEALRCDDRCFHANDVGDLIIAKMKPAGFNQISRTHLIDPTRDVGGRRLVWSHPAFANRSIYIRNDDEIRCYSLADEEAAKR